MLKDHEDKILSDAVRVYGMDAQIDMLTEECAELIQAICKYKRRPSDDTRDKVEEEIADVQIMIEQMLLFFNVYSVLEWRELKLMRLEARIAKSEKDGDAK